MAHDDTVIPRDLQPELSVTDSSRRFWLVVATLGFAAAIGALNGMSVNVFLPFIAEDLGSSVPVIGQMLTIVFLLGAGMVLITGPLADWFGQRRFLLVGMVTVGITAAGAALAQDVSEFVIARLASTFASAVLISTSLAMAATLYDGQQRRQAISWIVASTAGAPIVGVPILTSIASMTSWRGAFIALVLVSAAASGVIALLVPGPTGAQRHDIPFRMSEFLAAYPPLLTDRSMRPLYLSVLLRSIGWMGCLLYFGAYLRHAYAADHRAIGWAFMAAGGGFLVGSVFAGSMLKNVELRPLYSVASFTIAPCTAIAMLFPISIIASVAAFSGAAICASIGQSSMATLLADTTPAGRNSTMSLNTAVASLGTAGGSLIGAVLIVVGGYALLGVGLAGFTALSAVLVVWPAIVSRAGSVTIEGSRA
ncbi:MAG TPA: MFS transporter [Thermomicrobiales bacterium]|nr:MFS transporter [Thermomicrobiales bacterium]